MTTQAMAEGERRILSTYRVPERVAQGMCPMCERQRQIAFDVTAARGGGGFVTYSVCDECASRAARLLAWLGEVMS